MFRPISALSALCLFVACGGPAERVSAPDDASSRAGMTPPANPSDVPPEIRYNRDVPPGFEYFPPSPQRELTDLVAGCPHMNPDRRPRGSNCHGIFPEQCGADKASDYVGRSATPAIRETIIAFSPNGDVRFIKPGDAVIEDLRYGRLNIHLSEAGVIKSADCY